MIEGIIVCAALILGLIGLYFYSNRETKKVIERMPIPPLPEVKPTAPARQATANRAFEAEYGKVTDWGKAAREEREAQERRAIRRDAEEREARLRRQRIREEEEERQRQDAYNYDSSADLLTTVAVTAAAVVVAETLYDSFVDTTPAQEYSSPTPSYEPSYTPSYSDSSSSSNWGGDSGSSSSYDSGSSDSSSW